MKLVLFTLLAFAGSFAHAGDDGLDFNHAVWDLQNNAG
jgi:hypothetical protein